MRASPNSTSGGIAGSGLRLAAQRPALQAGGRCRRSASLHGARARCEQIEKAGAGEFPGFPVEARRAINLAAIACAEVLCLRLARTNAGGVGARGDVAARVERVLRRPRRLRVHHERHRQGAEPAASSAAASHRKSRSAPSGCAPRPPISARFETVPIPESCGVSEGDVLAHGSQGVTAARLPNVVAEDTWDLFKVLLR